MVIGIVGFSNKGIGGTTSMSVEKKERAYASF